MMYMAHMTGGLILRVAPECPSPKVAVGTSPHPLDLRLHHPETTDWVSSVDPNGDRKSPGVFRKK